MRHINYLKFIIRHKWFVFTACLKCGVPFWRAVIHDWHKFLPDEWFAYANTFYTWDGEKQYVQSRDFPAAWNRHQKRGKHHWQYWLITWDKGATEPLDMPLVYVKEMIADWWGAGRVITGNWDAKTWYESNKTKITLTDHTRSQVEELLQQSSLKFETPELIAIRRRILGH